MRSVYVRLLFAIAGTLTLASAGFLFLFFSISRPVIEGVFGRFLALNTAEAVETLTEEGVPATNLYLTRLNERLGFSHYLLDASGRNAITGTDQSTLIPPQVAQGGKTYDADGRIIVVTPSADGRYRLVVAAVPPVQLTDFIPYYVLILATVALLSLLLTRGIVSPIRDIAGIVTEFGGGKFAARAVVNRSDEIGKLASAFNQMADRIETLVTAERRLLQDVSHELRSPLTRLNLAIELSRGAADQNASADRLQREAERLTRLVDTLLEVTRLEAETPATSEPVVNVAEVVDEVVTDCGLEATHRGCELIFDMPKPMSAKAQGNRELLRRAVENVVRNAIRYAPKGTPVLVRCVPDRRGEIVVSVRDFGPGVPDDALAHLGSPFYRADPSRDSATGGLGLGLAIARRAIQLHHGSWSAVNANPGLSVEMSIPAAADAA